MAYPRRSKRCGPTTCATAWSASWIQQGRRSRRYNSGAWAPPAASIGRSQHHGEPGCAALATIHQSCQPAAWGVRSPTSLSCDGVWVCWRGLILDSRVVMGQFWCNRLFLQASHEGHDRGGIVGKSLLISNTSVLRRVCTTAESNMSLLPIRAPWPCREPPAGARAAEAFRARRALPACVNGLPCARPKLCWGIVMVIEATYGSAPSGEEPEPRGVWLGCACFSWGGSGGGPAPRREHSLARSGTAPSPPRGSGATQPEPLSLGSGGHWADPWWSSGRSLLHARRACKSPGKLNEVVMKKQSTDTQ